MPKLRWTLGAESGEVELDGPLTFGRSSENALVLDDPNVSSAHGAVEPDGSGRWRAVDRGSTNGLLWGGARKPEIPLVDGTEFSAGDVRFRFVDDAPKSVAAVGSVAKTTVMGIPVPVVETAAPPASVPPPSPAAPGRSVLRHPGVLAAIAILLVGSLWLLFRRPSREPGMPIFASEAEKETIRLRRDLGSPVYATRWGAYDRLKKRGEKPDPVPLWILDLKTHPDDDLREAAAEKLGKRRDPRAIPQLRWSKENDSDWNVRSEAEDALEEMGIED